MNAAFPLIKRKLRAPGLPDAFIPRTNLLERLQEGLDPQKRLTFVAAGPGYGKSTTVAHYVRQSSLRFAWLNLEPSDADLTTFLHYLFGAAAAAWPEANGQARELLAATPNPATILPNLIGLFAEELGDRGEEPFILVLDDFHAVQEALPVVEAVDALIGYLPENVQLIVLSRTQVPLRLPQLKIRQQLVELGIPDLRFRPDEIARLVRSVSGRDLDEVEAQRLFDSTEGWAASLIMAAQQGVLPRPEEGNPSLFDYLAQEVFLDLPEDRQDFLLRTSLLPVVESEVCAEALGLGHVDATIAALKRANLLLSRDDTAGGYYHPIFQAFLLARLQANRSSTEVSAWRRAVARSLQGQHPEDALEVLLGGKLFQEAARVLEAVGPRFLAQFRLEALDRLIARFPSEVVEREPWLLLWGGEVRRHWGEGDVALSRFERARDLARAAGDRRAEGRALAYQAALWGGRGDERLLELAESALAVLPEDDHEGLAFAWNAKGLHHQMANEARAARDAFEQALAAYQRAEDLGGQSKVLHNLGLAHARAGDFARAVATYRGSIRQAEAGGRRAYPATYNNLAAVQHSLGEWDAAWRTAEEGLGLAQQLGARRDEQWTILTLGMIASALDQHPKAADLFLRAREGALVMGDRPLEAQALSGMAELARLQGQLERSEELLSQAIAVRGAPLDAPGMVDLQIPVGQLALEKQQWDRALDVLACARETLRSQDYRFRLAQVRFLESRALRGLGDPRAAEAHAEARALCEANGYAALLAHHRLDEARPAESLVELSQTIPARRGPALRIRCFGTFEAFTEAGAIATKQWQGTKTKLVLAFLLAHQQGVSREQLAELLYGDEDVSRSAILMIISRLRQALEPDLAKNAPSRYIQWREGRYFFNFGAPYELDVQVFEYHLEQSQATDLDAAQQLAELEQALSLYRGRYLKDLGESLWAQSMQEHYHQRALAAFQRVIVMGDAAAQPETVLRWADRALEADNCAEFAHRAKMQALAKLGNRQGAIRHFQQLSDVLDRELGVTPAPESRALYERILAGAF